MAQVIFTPDRGAIKEFLAGSAGAAVRIVRQTADETKSLAMQSAPVDKGGLRGSHVTSPVVVTGDSVVGGVEAQTKYAMFVHDGTKPHVIVPRNKKVLAWVPRGSGQVTVFASKVNHPGTTAQPWLAKSAELASLRYGMNFTEN